MRYGAHDTICWAIHLPFLAGKQRPVIPACDQKHRTPPTTTACAVMMRNGYNNGGLLRVSRCSAFVMNLLVLLKYTGCYLQYLMFVSNFGVCYNCTVSYCIFLRAYCDMYRSLCIGGVSVYRFSPNNYIRANGGIHPGIRIANKNLHKVHINYKTAVGTPKDPRPP